MSREASNKFPLPARIVHRCICTGFVRPLCCEAQGIGASWLMVSCVWCSLGVADFHLPSIDHSLKFAQRGTPESDLQPLNMGWFVFGSVDRRLSVISTDGRLSSHSPDGATAGVGLTFFLRDSGFAFPRSRMPEWAMKTHTHTHTINMYIYICMWCDVMWCDVM